MDSAGRLILGGPDSWTALSACWPDVSWSDLLGGVVAGLIATGILTGCRWGWLRRRRKVALGCREGKYRPRRKVTGEQAPETLIVEVQGNRLVVTAVGAEFPYAGTIVMNDQFLQTGRGAYSQVKNGQELWGTWDAYLIADPRKILVDQTYAHFERKDQVFAGWVWEWTGPLDH